MKKKYKSPELTIEKMRQDDVLLSSRPKRDDVNLNGEKGVPKSLFDLENIIFD